jgi:hypothetical protein
LEIDECSKTVAMMVVPSAANATTASAVKTLYIPALLALWAAC